MTRRYSAAAFERRQTCSRCERLGLRDRGQLMPGALNPSYFSSNTQSDESKGERRLWSGIGWNGNTCKAYSREANFTRSVRFFHTEMTHDFPLLRSSGPTRTG